MRVLIFALLILVGWLVVGVLSWAGLMMYYTLSLLKQIF